MKKLDQLEKYKVVALNDKGVKETEGGNIFMLQLYITYQISLFCEGFKDGWNESKMKS